LKIDRESIKIVEIIINKVLVHGETLLLPESLTTAIISASPKLIALFYLKIIFFLVKIVSLL